MPYNPAGGSTYNLNSSISSTATTITLSSFTEPVSGTPYTMVLLNTNIAFATIAPRTSSSEFISFTNIVQNGDGTATLTGVTRGLAKKYPFTEDVTFKLPHSGQSQFILSDAPQVWTEYPAKANDEDITGLWNFEQTPTGLNPGAVPDASDSVKGITELSVPAVSPTTPIAVGDNDPRITKPVSCVLFTRSLSAASATVNVPHGLGRLPSFIEATALYASDPLSLQCIGTYDGTNTKSIYLLSAAGPTLSQDNSTTNFMVLVPTSGNTQNAIVTMDATNVIFTWTKTGSPTGLAEILLKAY